MNPSKFIFNSNFRYHKLWGKGTKNTSKAAPGPVVLATGVPAGATWLIGHYMDGYIQSGQYGALRPNGELVTIVQRQAPVTTERFHWRVYVT